MKQQQPGDGFSEDSTPGGPVPPEFQYLMRATGTRPGLGNGKAPQHDHVTPDQLQDYERLFRSPSTPGQPDSRAALHPVSAPPRDIGSAYSQPSDVTYGARVPQSGEVATVFPPAGTPGGPPPSPGPGGVKPSPKKRSWRRVLVYVLAALMLYFTALAGIFAFSVGKVSAMPATQVPQTVGTNYLLVGSDGRGDITKKERKALHVGSVDGNRTDTIMVLHVPTLGTPTLVSIPRDSWVPIPGHGSDKINAAFAIGGPQLLIETVELTTGLHIDNYVEVGMVGVARVTDALGGVTLCPERNYNDKNSNLKVKKGCQEMDGPTALAYVRMRYADPKGDLGRAERQQEYMKSATMKAMSPLTWLNPFKMFSLTTTAGDSLTVDESTGIVDDARMGMAMGMISMGLGESVTVPVAEKNYLVDGQQAVKWDTPAALALFESIGGN
jgi:LCP family protein required for cell wall assembly